jgi:hypothetical protein
MRLPCHGVLYEPDNRHQNNAANAATGHISEHAAASINTGGTQNSMKYLATDATADDPDYAVTDGTQTEILEECTADISPNSPEHELNNQSHIHIAPPLILPCLTAETTCRVPARSKLAPHHHSNAPPKSPDHYFTIAAVSSAGCMTSGWVSLASSLANNVIHCRS